MIFRLNLKCFLTSVAIPLVAGGLSAFITRGNMDLYPMIKSPAFAPPAWLFPIVWGILYFLMGISLYIIRNSKISNFKKQKAYRLFALQLLFNFIWSPIFFNYQRFLLAFFVLILLWITTLLMIVEFNKISKTAARLQIPYIIWLTFAGYLNLAIYLLNG